MNDLLEEEQRVDEEWRKVARAEQKSFEKIEREERKAISSVRAGYDKRRTESRKRTKQIEERDRLTKRALETAELSRERASEALAKLMGWRKFEPTAEPELPEELRRRSAAWGAPHANLPPGSQWVRFPWPPSGPRSVPPPGLMLPPGVMPWMPQRGVSFM